jgi:glycosyltransferase involved in cell wall biosynthesis
MPKVSILVPAFRPDYLDVCIVSALNQTVGDFELLISDDSEGDSVESVVSKWQDHRIKYFKNPNRQMPGANRDFLISMANGKYIKFLFDDDYLMPQSVELLVSAAEQLDAKLVFTGRHIVDSLGKILSSPLYVQSGTMLLLTSEQYFENMIGNCFNFIGEPSNVLIDTQTLRSIPNPFGLENIRMRFLTDVSLYTNIAHRGLKIAGVGYIGSAFRQHGTQTSGSNNPNFSAGVFEWESFLRWSVDRGRLTIQQYQRAIDKWMDIYRLRVKDFPEINHFIELAGEGENGCYFNERFRNLLSLVYDIIELKKMRMQV